MPGHLDRHMAPGRVHDVEGVVVDERPLLRQVGDNAAGGPGDFPHAGRRLRGQHQEHPRAHLIGGQVLLGDQVLALPGLAVDHGNTVRVRPRLDSAGEPAREPHQAGVVQLIVGAAVQAPPPVPEPARVVPQREVGVQHDPVHAVIAPGQQVPVPLGEVIGHPPTVRISGASRQPDCPQGATPSGRSPGWSVRHLRCQGLRFVLSFMAGDGVSLAGGHAQARAQRGRRPDPAKHRRHRPVPQQVQVIDTVRPADHPGHQAAHLQVRVHPAPAGKPHVLTSQLRQARRWASAITGTRPALDTRWGSSNVAWIFAKPCNNRTCEVSSQLGTWKCQQLPSSHFRGHLSRRRARTNRYLHGGSRLRACAPSVVYAALLDV